MLGEHDLVRKLCREMRVQRANHLDALYYQARLALVSGDLGRAQPLLERVLRRDPEHWAARWSYGGVLLMRGESSLGLACCREAARGATEEQRVQERTQEEQRVWDGALAQLESYDFMQRYTASPEDTPVLRALRGVLTLEQWWQAEAFERAVRLARSIIAEFPRLVKPRLLLAEWLAATGEPLESASHLHEARNADPGGRVARRLGYPALTAAYTIPRPDQLVETLASLPEPIQQLLQEGSLWQAPFAFELPRVAAKRMTDVPISPQLLEIKRELRRIEVDLGQRRMGSKSVDATTAEAIVVAREPLLRLYGSEATEDILNKLRELAEVKSNSGNIASTVFVVDEQESLDRWKLQTRNYSNAATIKALLDQLEERMDDRGMRLTYVLLIGGHEIIPHHRLPNPVDDYDLDVPSDNPYAARGDNYLIPSRAVGRLPHERHSPELLLGQLTRLIDDWRALAVTGKGGVKGWFGDVFGRFSNARDIPAGESFGFSAQIWSEAADAVFRTLDTRGELVLSPPVTSEKWEQDPLPQRPFYYFNLHGIEDNAAWYGQVDPQRSSHPEKYPTALTPAQLGKLSMQGAVVFTEACYGIKPHASKADASIALTAMAKGCALFVGATRTAYASFTPPLLAADLLAGLFWRAISGGATGGMALMQAKVELAELSMQRAGYLDVEEQKSLTSFLLYGDPSLPLSHRPSNADPAALQALAAKMRKNSLYQISTKGIPAEPVDLSILNEVRAYARPYLQGEIRTLSTKTHLLSITDAAPRLNERRARPRPKKVSGAQEHWHVTVTAVEEPDGEAHRKVMTMTLDKKGKVIRAHHSR
jgi:thioredoxin-like negative regulator of GroEL